MGFVTIKNRWTVRCAILGMVFVFLSMAAVSNKSATYDEPLHVATGWLNLWRGDFRLSPDVPPLWEYWIALPLGGEAMNFAAAPAKGDLDHQAIAALYQKPPARGIELVARSRWMSVPIALGLAVLAAVCAGQLGGGAAAFAAMFVFVLDPNWLGHGPLAKNDVAFAAVYFAAAYAIWRVGVRPGAGAVAAVVVLPAICLGTKLSGLMVGPVMVVCLLARAWMNQPWFGWTDRGLKTLAALAICAAAALVAYGGLWAQYQFRFDAGPGGLQLDLPAMTRDLRDAEVRSRWRVNEPTAEQLAEWRPGVWSRGMLWLARQRLVPQAWAAGFIYTQTQAGERTAFLLGERYAGGRIDYFPLAWLFKEPLAIIAGAVIALIAALRRRRWDWTALALWIPPSAYAAIALCSNVNVGLRHVFPVLPFICVGIGVTAGRMWTARRRWIAWLLAAGLIIETFRAYPDYLSFFNYAAGGENGGIALLGDSNLDWGQDLTVLKKWQERNPNTILYLDYFGTCDPGAYGIRYVNVPGGYVYGPPPPMPTPGARGMAAISATKLQGLFVADPSVDFAARFERAEPVDILGGTIYLFPYPP